jgi:hypothetical protein
MERRPAASAETDRLARIEELLAELTNIVCEHDKGMFAGPSPEGVARRNRMRETAHAMRRGETRD